MANDGQIVFEVTADGRHAIADIKEITRAIQQETGKWDNAARESADNINNNFSGMLKKLAAGFSAAKIGKALLDIGKQALDAASDLEEVQNVVDVTFGDNANQIEKWAKAAGNQFGLTETKAKQFSSTMGAMLKSSGLAGDKITDISTDLAGLAADMASFYNLDFDEAFSKIRSGISGQTMPLKELGIDMSVATLNAFALQQGLSKTFDQMSQSEQVMLRYQYLMSATADAQGDFARTSDGYANSIRRAESAVEGIKAQLGAFLIGPAADALNWVNDFLGKITSNDNRTVLDDFNDIQIDTENKLAEIQKVADEANLLSELLTKIGGSNAGVAIQNMAQGANMLNANSPSTWKRIASALQDVDGLNNIFGSNNKAPDNIESLAEALSGSSVDTNKADAWKTFLGALSENADAVSKLTGSSVEETKKWLSGMSTEVDKIDPADADAWDKLLNTLVQGLSVTDDGKAFAESVGVLATGANKLDSSSPGTWESILTSLKDIDGLNNIFGSNNKAPENIESLAEALSGSMVDVSKADAWKTFLGALSDNADAVSKLTGKDAEETKKWLDTLSDAVDDIDPEDVDAWNRLLTTLATGLSSDTPEGKKFLESLSTDLLALGKDSEASVNGLKALGFSSDEIAQKQTDWLETCKRLVQTIPGLNKIINTETGEVKGGTKAIDDYVEAWRKGQEKLAYLSMHEQKKTALEEAFNDLPGLKFESDLALWRLLKKYEKVQDLYKKYKQPLGYDKEGNIDISNFEGATGEELKRLKEFKNEAKDLAKAAFEASEKYRIRTDAYKEATEMYEDEGKLISDMFGGLKDVGDAQEDWFTKVGKTAEEVQTLTQNLQTALTEMSDYAQGVHDAVEKTVDSMISGFEKIETPMDKNRNKIEELEDAKKGLNSADKDYLDQLKKINDEIAKQRGQQISAQSMGKNLEQQAQYMEDYLKYLRKARALGVSNEVLASLSDGSAESYDYLEQLAKASPSEVKKINESYQQVIEKKKELTDELSKQQLSADKTYQTLAEKAKQAVAELDLEETAKTNAGKTVQGVAEGVASHLEEVQTAVDSIIAEVERLAGLGVNVTTDGLGGIALSKTSERNAQRQSNGNQQGFATGVDYVPYDMYARIHEGETILRREEANVYRAIKSGANAGVDMDTLGGVMRDNVKAGGNVYLDGKVVGNVISDRQGRSYKAMQRSGWQA